VTELVLVRHGETDWNRIGRVQGLSDIPLNDTGREQARHAGHRLADEQWDAVATSPLSRAAETAAIIAAELGLPEPEVVDSLVERNYGEAEGLTGEEIEARFGGVVQARESREQVVERVRPALLELADRHPGGRVLVVSHGGVIGSLVRDATRWAWPEAGSVIANGSDQRFEAAGGHIRLVSFNGKPWSDDLLPPVESVRTTD
jgi:probable phosphoglycerate mutase